MCTIGAHRPHDKGTMSCCCLHFDIFSTTTAMSTARTWRGRRQYVDIVGTTTSTAWRCQHDDDVVHRYKNFEKKYEMWLKRFILKTSKFKNVRNVRTWQEYFGLNRKWMEYLLQLYCTYRLACPNVKLEGRAFKASHFFHSVLLQQLSEHLACFWAILYIV